MQNFTINNGFYDPEENIDWEEAWEEELAWEETYQEMMEELYSSLESSEEMPELDKALGL